MRVGSLLILGLPGAALGASQWKVNCYWDTRCQYYSGSRYVSDNGITGCPYGTRGMIPLGSNIDPATHDICHGGTPNPQACVHSNQCGAGSHKPAPLNQCFSDFSEIWFRATCCVAGGFGAISGCT